jgi:hypothetical protein
LIFFASPPRRLTASRIAAIHDAWHAGEILKDHARGLERQLDRLLRVRIPGREALHVDLVDLIAIASAERGFEQDADRERQQIERDAEA